MTHVVTQHGVETRFVGTYGKLYGDCFARNAFYEQAFLDDIRALGHAGTYLDVGANIGNHALYFARLCRAERVYAFEPVARYADRVADNLAANSDENVRLMRFGLSDVSGARTIELNGRTFEIETRQLDDLDAEVEGSVTVMKIDVEGMEEHVLRGAAARIGRDHPVIFAEANTAEHLARVTSLLAGLAYTASGRRWNASPTYEFVPRR